VSPTLALTFIGPAPVVKPASLQFSIQTGPTTRRTIVLMLGDQDVTKNARVALDRLFQLDAVLSMSIGLLGVALPHAIMVYFVVEYNHNVHEMVRYVIQ
jgi:hypothetical protein